MMRKAHAISAMFLVIGGLEQPAAHRWTSCFTEEILQREHLEFHRWIEHYISRKLAKDVNHKDIFQISFQASKCDSDIWKEKEPLALKRKLTWHLQYHTISLNHPRWPWPKDHPYGENQANLFSQPASRITIGSSSHHTKESPNLYKEKFAHHSSTLFRNHHMSSEVSSLWPHCTSFWRWKVSHLGRLKELSFFRYQRIIREGNTKKTDLKSFRTHILANKSRHQSKWAHIKKKRIIHMTLHNI